MSAPSIETYRFGHIVIDGQPYDRDVIILPYRVLGGWWRKEGHAPPQVGHVLHPDDLKTVFDAMPEVLVVAPLAPLGVGLWVGYGKMRVAPETHQSRGLALGRQALQAASIELVALPTKEACQAYNRLRERRTAAAALHLTC